jgi:hypothetical protein
MPVAGILEQMPLERYADKHQENSLLSRLTGRFRLRRGMEK